MPLGWARDKVEAIVAIAQDPIKKSCPFWILGEWREPVAVMEYYTYYLQDLTVRLQCERTTSMWMRGTRRAIARH